MVASSLLYVALIFFSTSRALLIPVKSLRRHHISTSQLFASTSKPTSAAILGDDEFNDLLLGGDEARPTPVATSSGSNDQQPAGGKLTKPFEAAMTILAKSTVPRLRQLIAKYDNAKLPPTGADLETHASAALESTWSVKNGDWEGLLELLNKELKEHTDMSSQWLTKAATLANGLTEKKIKDMIVSHGEGRSSVPKLDRKKHIGRFLKQDYLAVLLDILREANENDYERVTAVLEAEVAKGGATLEKKGFGGGGGAKKWDRNRIEIG
jgi:hypothetical protein